jgi:electron transport complex protein RnfG
MLNPENATKASKVERSTLLFAVTRHAVGLALFAVLAAGIIALTHSLTEDKIKTNQAHARMKALYDLAPVGSFDNDLLQDHISLQDPSMRTAAKRSNLGPLPIDAAIHIARKRGQIVQWLVPAVAPGGYTAPIRLWVGIYPDGRLSGVRVVQHQETPGLGDKIELKKSSWVLQFDGKHLNMPAEKYWKVKKDGGDFDQLTGATITPRAIVQAVKSALLFYRDAQPLLMSLAQEKDSKATKIDLTDSEPVVENVVQGERL